MSVELRSIYDVAIVGAGPAGSSAAIRLAQNGLKVLLVEQKKFPRAKLCGEFISPECLMHFAELGVLSEMTSVGGVPLDRTVFYARNGKFVAVPSEWFKPDSYALGLSRAEMDQQLLLKAREAGAHVLVETQALDLLFDENKVCGIKLRGKDRKTFEVRTALTMDATGRTRLLARQIAKSKANGKKERADFVAFKAHLAGAKVPDGDCEIYAYRGGYGGCSQVEKGVHNLCFIISTEIAKKYRGDADELLRNVVFENERAKHSLRDARPVDDWLAVPIESYGRAELSPATGLLTIGDAAAFIDPFTGSGMLLAFESSKIAAGVIIDEYTGDGSLRSCETISDEYRRQYSVAFDRRLRISSLVRHAAFVPFFAETVIKFLSLSRSLTRRLAAATRP